MHGVHLTDILFCHMHTHIIELIILYSTNNTFGMQLMLGFIAWCFSMWVSNSTDCRDLHVLLR